jgi:serine/threonine-protein kinase RsbW
MSRSIHTIRIPSATRYLEKVRRFVAHHAREADFPKTTVSAMQLAVDEACANVIEHAYMGDDNKPIDVDVIVKPDRLIVRIRDEGRSFNMHGYREPNILEFAHDRKDGGFGVHLMRKLMDRVEYRSRGDSNECCLTMYRVAAENPDEKSAQSKKVTRKNR